MSRMSLYSAIDWHGVLALTLIETRLCSRPVSFVEFRSTTEIYMVELLWKDTRCSKAGHRTNRDDTSVNVDLESWTW